MTLGEEELFGPREELPGGLLKKQLGKVAQAGPESNPRDWDVRVVVDSIVVDPKCSQYAPKPTRGHRLVATIRVETSPSFSAVSGRDASTSAWSTIGADGVDETPSPSVCDVDTMIPNQMRPAAKYRGQVSLDTAHTSGQLVLLQTFVWDFTK
ncbi:hypothetical protein ACQEVB_40715 [Pseudonocardia sp. CA-107938]|uniref:hypothetical protein n=1 Tax=Pseudonocardia sp. CA-107938 TaxID=3240021 RepID=UPI003D8F366A